MIDYYPKYNFFKSNLESLFPEYKDHVLNIYVDVKNASRSLYYQDYILEIYDYMLQNGGFDITTFFSFFGFSIRLRNFFKDLGFKDVNLFFFLDHGKSIYHSEIIRGYKKSRSISSFTIDSRIVDNFYTCINTNYKISEKILNYLEGIYFIRLYNLESDFVPHYLITRKFNNRDDIYHLIFSTDKDMLQTLIKNKKVYQYVKRSKDDHRLVVPQAIINYILKDDQDDYSYLKDYIVPLMSLTGDAGDDVDGIKGIGYKTALKIIDYFHKNNITPQMFEQNIYSLKPFDLPDDIKMRKLISKVNDNLQLLRNAYRLISFDALLEYIDIKSGLKEDKYNFGYKLNKESKNNLDRIDEILNMEKIGFTYEEIVKLLTQVSKSACCKYPQFTYEELQKYFGKV